jgi:hypothetical protein
VRNGTKQLKPITIVNKPKKQAEIFFSKIINNSREKEIKTKPAIFNFGRYFFN